MRLVFSLITLLLSITSITALTYTDTDATGFLTTELDTFLNFDKFDPALGTITAIKLTITGSGIFNITLTNNGVSEAADVDAAAQSTVRITSSLSATTVQNTMNGNAPTTTLAAGASVTYNNIPGNNNFVINASPTQTASTFSDFVGPSGNSISGTPATINVIVRTVSGFQVIGGGGNIATSQATKVNVDGVIEYTYTAAVSGDPQFAGFQGQQFQFHGLPDTVFNLVSSPELQMNAQFVYIASGVCNYNGTACFSHPGTYLGQVGVAIGEQTFTLVSGPHSKGLKAYVQNGEDRHAMAVGAKFSFTTAHGVMSISHPTNGNVEIRSPNFLFNVVNSDSFFNLEASLLNTQLLHTGAKKHNIKHCKDTVATEASLMKHYPIKNFIHGLVGQTWRAVSFCDQPFQGVVGDYIASDLHSNDYRYNYFNSTE